PAMSNTPEEAEEMAMAAQAVVLNLGTLTEDRAEAMLLAGKAANQKEVPVILDPIAVGATVFRTNIIYDILNTIDVSVIKANRSEEHTSELQSRFDMVCRLLLEQTRPKSN